MVGFRRINQSQPRLALPFDIRASSFILFHTTTFPSPPPIVKF
jgi:hypothetical protein